MTKSLSKSKSTQKTPARPAATPSKTPSAKAATGALAGYLILARGKPLRLVAGEGIPKGGVLERGDQATLFKRLNGAQAAVRRTESLNRDQPKGLQGDQCEIIRLDQPPSR